jgi:hypothetical protein
VGHVARVLVVGAVLLTQACVATVSNRTPLAMAMAGGPTHQLHDALMRDPPACILIPPGRKRPEMPVSPARIDRAVERFLAVRFDRVIAGRQRDELTRHLALDLDDTADRAAFAKSTGCQHALSVRATGGGLSYAVTWVERRLGLELELTRIGAPEHVLWRARDVGARGDGDLPLSPLAVAGAMFRAARLAGDRGQGAALLDDILWRMMASLPDFRGLAYSRPQSARPSMNSTVMPSGSRK